MAFIRPSARVRRQGPRAAASAVASADAQHPPWYKDHGIRKMMFPVVLIYLTQVCTGFDATLTANLQSFKKWRADMGTPTPSQLGLITAIYFIGTFCGSVPASIITDKFGRKIGLAIGQGLTIVGAAFQGGSQSRGQYMGARFILGFGIAFITCAGPALLSELVHPRMRGTLVSFFNPFWYLGSIIAAWTCFGTSHMAITNAWAWRIPSLLQGLIPCFVVPSIYFIPESPRWLVANGREDEATAILAKYHGEGNAEDPLVRTQLVEIKVAMQQATEGVTWRALFTQKQNRARVLIVMCMTLMALWCMQNVITYYFSPILNTIGITGTTQQTGINGGINIVCLLSAILGASIAERVGRRPLWMSSFIGMILVAVPFTALSAVYAQRKVQGAGYGVIVCLFLYDVAYNIACNPLLYSYPTEIMPFYMRSRGLAVKNLTGQVALIINMYVNPIALAAIGYHYYIFFIGLNLFWLTMIYLFFPETKGYSLEELAVLFDDGSENVLVQGQKVVGETSSDYGVDNKGQASEPKVEEVTASAR
ncbi:Lactose permease [Cyphellophora attinorum]|uniref:Lactose permease n=1 Tax=Cyphellophora attinorum TaxID=1664694 RepID=A0A0N1P483_9EURO|nr:Lactose permease [Phialophora attinorum]KPI45215.1 Lactose permease [Phialophora attinorum]